MNIRMISLVSLTLATTIVIVHSDRKDDGLYPLRTRPVVTILAGNDAEDHQSVNNWKHVMASLQQQFPKSSFGSSGHFVPTSYKKKSTAPSTRPNLHVRLNTDADESNYLHHHLDEDDEPLRGKHPLIEPFVINRTLIRHTERIGDGSFDTSLHPQDTNKQSRYDDYNSGYHDLIEHHHHYGLPQQPHPVAYSNIQYHHYHKNNKAIGLVGKILVASLALPISLFLSLAMLGSVDRKLHSKYHHHIPHNDSLASISSSNNLSYATRLMLFGQQQQKQADSSNNSKIVNNDLMLPNDTWNSLYPLFSKFYPQFIFINATGRANKKGKSPTVLT